jgi:hypothetical protein
LELNFHEITLKDRDWLTELFRLGGRTSLDYSFTTCYVWRYIFAYRAARMDDYAVVKAETEGGSYLFPTGRGPLLPVVNAIAADAKEHGTRLRFNTLLQGDKEWLEANYPDRFDFIPCRQNADYIYEAERLSALTGKKLAAKRNHINRFVEAYPDWTYEPITGENIGAVRRMNLEWNLASEDKQDELLSGEYCAVEQAMRHFDELGLSGGLIRAGGRVMAFSIGDPLSDDTFLVHFEKAFADVQGAYQIINREFVKNNCALYAFVDREEDAGVEGLRKAKLSYDPFRLVDKYAAIMRE